MTRSNIDLNFHIETDRLILREIDADSDSRFILELLNSPKFIKYIGDRGVRTIDESRDFIENRYRQSYRKHGYGLYTVELRNMVQTATKTDAPVQIGICGFVKRETLPDPDLGFAFLPEFEGKGFGFESAEAVIKYGREILGFKRVMAITSQDNEVSGRLLEKLGFRFDKIDRFGEENLKLFSADAYK